MDCKEKPADKTTGGKQGDSSFVDDLESLFDRYSELAQERDEKMAKNWTEVASDTLIFSGLFSAVDVAFLVMSFQDLRPDPQDKPTFYLENIYQLLADPNRTLVPTAPTLSIPPTFSPSKSTVWVNSLWFLSLVITLSCSLLAILVQQWARQYIKVTQRHSASSPHKRARIRAIFYKGVEEQHLQLAVDTLPILLHASLVLFLVGLVLFSFVSHHTVFKVVVSWVGLCAFIYVCFTLSPIIRYESPYYTPLSHPLWLLFTGILFRVIKFLRWCAAFGTFSWKTWDDLGRLKDHYGRRFSHRIEEVAEEAAEESAPKLRLETDSCILLWALQSSDEDCKVQQFFESIPDSRSSKVLDEFRAAFKTSNGEKMADSLVGLMVRTLSSRLIPEPTKQRRINIYKAIAKASLLINQRILDRVLHKDWGLLLDSVEFGLLLRNARYSDPFAEYCSQCVVSVIISRVKEHDDRWFALATSQLDISRSTLENYLSHGNSMLLANCTFICRRTLKAYSENRWPLSVYSRSKTLELVSRFDVQDTLPELQNEFCDMWNDTKDRYSQNLSIYILKHIRKVYRELHPDNTDPAIGATDDDDIVLLFLSSYPSCKIRAHRRPPAPGSPKVDDGGGKKSGVSPSARTASYADSIRNTSAKDPSPRGNLPASEDVPSTATRTHAPTATPITDDSRHNTSDVTAGATTQRIPNPTNASQAGIVFAGVQSVGGIPAAPQQPLRVSPAEGEGRLTGPRVNVTNGTSLTSASSTASYSRDAYSKV